jgi:hypothetical protein
MPHGLQNNIRAVVLAAAAMSTFATAASAEDRVYLLAHVSVNDTTFAEAEFLYDKDATTIAECERDIARGRNGGQWQYYGHFVGKRRGIATSVEYRCVKSSLEIEEWHSAQVFNHVYLIDLRGGAVDVAEQEHYAACLAALHRVQKTETADYFCAKSKQLIRAASAP